MSKIIKCWKLNYFPRLWFWGPFTEAQKGPWRGWSGNSEHWATQASLRWPRLPTTTHHWRRELGKLCSAKWAGHQSTTGHLCFSVAKVFQLLVHWAISSRCRTLHPFHSQKSLQLQGFLYFLRGSRADSIVSTLRSHKSICRMLWTECWCHPLP